MTKTMRRRRTVRATSPLALLAITMTIMTGCHKMDDIGYDPKVADPETVRTQVESHLKDIRRIADLPKGKQNPPGALISLDAMGVKRGYFMDGGWSVYGLSNHDIGAGYERVRTALPEAGWKILKEGRDPMGERDPEIQAEHFGDHAKLSLEWLQPVRDKGPVLLATVHSRIYVAPPGIDLNTKI